MRRGIGLRGYAQQDPLNEFRREAFELYEELRGLIRHGVASTIFRVTVTRAASRRPATGRSGRGRVAGAGAAAIAAGSRAGAATAHGPYRCRCRVARHGRRGRRRRGRRGSADPARRADRVRRPSDAIRESLGDSP